MQKLWFDEHGQKNMKEPCAFIATHQYNDQMMKTSVSEKKLGFVRFRVCDLIVQLKQHE